jgi:hypothetical protein
MDSRLSGWGEVCKTLIPDLKFKVRDRRDAGPTTWFRLSRNDAVAATGSCDASSQNVSATPSSREKTGARFGLAAGSGDEASPTPSATGASQLLALQLRFSTASFRLRPSPCSRTFPGTTAAGQRLCPVVESPSHSARPGDSPRPRWAAPARQMGYQRLIQMAWTRDERFDARPFLFLHPVPPQDHPPGWRRPQVGVSNP